MDQFSRATVECHEWVESLSLRNVTKMWKKSLVNFDSEIFISEIH